MHSIFRLETPALTAWGKKKVPERQKQMEKLAVWRAEHIVPTWAGLLPCLDTTQFSVTDRGDKITGFNGMSMIYCIIKPNNIHSI